MKNREKSIKYIERATFLFYREDDELAVKLLQIIENSIYGNKMMTGEDANLLYNKSKATYASKEMYKDLTLYHFTLYDCEHANLKRFPLIRCFAFDMYGQPIARTLHRYRNCPHKEYDEE